MKIHRKRICGLLKMALRSAVSVFVVDARYDFTFERGFREITIVKRNGRRSIFDRDKLGRSFEIALRKRDVDTDDVARAINEIVRS